MSDPLSWVVAAPVAGKGKFLPPDRRIAVATSQAYVRGAGTLAEIRQLPPLRGGVAIDPAEVVQR